MYICVIIKFVFYYLFQGDVKIVFIVDIILLRKRERERKKLVLSVCNFLVEYDILMGIIFKEFKYDKYLSKF